MEPKYKIVKVSDTNPFHKGKGRAEGTYYILKGNKIVEEDLYGKKFAQQILSLVKAGDKLEKKMRFEKLLGRR